MSTLAQQSLQQPHIATATALVPGLRVRMGIASGVLGEKEHDVLSCRVLEVARVVSDAAIGGQVLMDSTTFKAIKDRWGYVCCLRRVACQQQPAVSYFGCCDCWAWPHQDRSSAWYCKLSLRHSGAWQVCRVLVTGATLKKFGSLCVPCNL